MSQVHGDGMSTSTAATPIRTWVATLRVTNFRRFEEVSLELDPTLSVLVAPNGGGKTALLDALSVGLRSFVDIMCESKASHGFDKTDMRLSRTAEGQMVPQPPITLDVSGHIDGRPTDWHRELGSPDGRTTYAQAAALADRAKGLLRDLQDYADGRRKLAPNLPVIAYYGTGRLWNSARLSEARKKGASSFDRQTHAYLDCLTPSSSFAGFVLWFEAVVREAQNETASGLMSPHRPALLLEAVRRSTNLVLEGCGWRNLDWDFIAGDIVADSQTEGRLPVSLLSDGLRNMIALVADLAHRAVRLNPHLGADAPLHAPGIVLIDEVDMHLHPEWQQTVLAQLRNAFGQVQFIVTTHSPQVLSTVGKECIRVIHKDGTITVPSQQTKGVESPVVLAQVLGVDPLPPVLEARWVSDYEAAVESGDKGSDWARELREKIVAHFGPLHPVVLELERLERWHEFKRARGERESE